MILDRKLLGKKPLVAVLGNAATNGGIHDQQEGSRFSLQGDKQRSEKGMKKQQGESIVSTSPG